MKRTRRHEVPIDRDDLRDLLCTVDDAVDMTVFTRELWAELRAADVHLEGRYTITLVFESIDEER